MNKRVISVFSIIICAVFALTLGATVFALYSDYRTGLEAAEKRFEKLSAQTTEASDAFSYNSREFISLFNNSVGSPAIYNSIVLDVNGQNIYVYPSEPSEASTFMVKTFSRRITSSSGTNINLTAGIYTLTPQNIYYRLKIAFIIILCGTLLTGILILYLYLSTETASEGKSEKIDFDSSFSDFDDDFTSEAEEESAEQEKIQEEEITSEPENKASEADNEEQIDYYPMESAYSEHSENQEQDEAVPADVSESTDAGNTAEENAEDLKAETEAETESENTEQNEETAVETEKKDSEENGLFAPESGFGYESYMMSRLDNELIRSASSEQDLSLMLIRIPGMTKNSSYFQKMCKVLSDIFIYKDLIFEYEADGFAVIIQNKDVDKTMETAEALYAELNTILTTSGELSKPLIGISSRSLRLISAERIKTEAIQAIKHADEDKDSPIVAFRVNPEKYRKYIQNN